MTKSLSLLLLHLVIGLHLCAQTIEYKTRQKISAKTSIYIQQHSKGQLQTENYVLKTINGKLFISCLAKVNGQFNEQDVLEMGGFVGTKIGNIRTLQVPIEKVREVSQIQTIEYFTVDEPIFPAMDSARKKAKIDSLWMNTQLPFYMNGKDVVVGIIDIGFDYNHPSFYDTAFVNHRISKVWEQRKTTGTPPNGFSYGSELKSLSDMVASQYDALESHGTHVAGIAAGSGYCAGNNMQYRGVAHGAEIVMVGITPPSEQWTSTGMTDIIDGTNYVFQYAQSKNLPAIVNLSWGCSIGSHDGESLFSEAMDALVGPGKIFCLSAGNNGENKLHLSKTFSNADTTISSFITFPSGLSTKRSWLDLWGESNQNYNIQFFLYDDLSNSKIDSTVFISSNNISGTYYLLDAQQDTLFIDYATESSSFNGRPRLLFDLVNKTNLKLGFTINGNSGTLHSWLGYVQSSTGYYGQLHNNNLSWATNGDTNYTIGDMGTTKRAITVGAYASKSNSYWPNTLNDIARFSSLGPTLDGRTKPDITAPGLVVVSGVNSFDPDFTPAGSSAVLNARSFNANGKTYRYARLAGTSMSSPFCAGVIALMLQIDPTLSPEKIKDVLGATALKDNFTGPLNVPDDTWGFGKINGYHAVVKIWESLGLNNQISGSHRFKLFPNPSYDVINFEIPTSTTKLIRSTIFDSHGRIVAQNLLESDQRSINVTNLAHGVYYLQLFVDNQLMMQSFIKN